jgi:GWxTD domain-containing protein
MFLIISAGTAFSQLVDKTLRPGGKELFYFDPMIFYSNEQKKARLDAYIEIPLENLQFKKNYSTKMYDASVNYTVKITNSANEVVINESISDYVSTSKEDQKKLDESAKFIVKEYYLNPDKYRIEITLSDINTKTEKTINTKFDVIDFTQKDVSFSDIMLVSNIKIDGAKKVITPLVDRNIENLKVLYLFYEIYNSKNESIKSEFTYRIINSKEQIVVSGKYNYTLIPGINKFFEKIPTDNIVFGDYRLEVYENNGANLLAQKMFSNKMVGFPVNAKDLNLLVDQLIYIANGEELSKIKDAPNSELKEKYFIEFWRSKDPSPGSAKNELMLEYYKRINTANERYSHYIDGWKTDMGMVYIIYGEPSNIERYPFTENTKPYEIWDFYSVNRQFIFVDDSGFGDYKLTIPIWDDAGTRIKN